MVPYFFDLQTSLFSDNEKEQILEVADKNKNQFISYVSRFGYKDGNELWKGDDLSSLPCVKKYLDLCNIEVFAMFVRHSPGASVIKHTDEPNKRNCVISTPIRPLVNYSPTYYYISRESTEPVAIATFTNLNSCLLNTQEVHALTNTSNESRLNIQLAFNDSFDTVLNLIKQNKLFNISN
jgi:hypothetical protein